MTRVRGVLVAIIAAAVVGIGSNHPVSADPSSRPLAADSVTVNVTFLVPLLPSVTDTLLIVNDGVGSLSTIVPTPWLSAIVALTGSVCEIGVSVAVDMTSSISVRPRLRLGWQA